MVEFKFDPTGIEPWTGRASREEIKALKVRVAEEKKKIAAHKKLIKKIENRLEKVKKKLISSNVERRELKAAEAELKKNEKTLRAAKQHKLDAAIAFAEREWFRELDESEWGHHDPRTAFRLARTDREYYDAVKKWAQEHATDLTLAWKSFLFDILIEGRPSGREKPVKHREHARLKSIAKTLEEDHGFQLTRNETTEEESVTSILERLGIPGEGGKPMSESSFKRILKKQS